ncbi:hypothetical protein [Halorussus sp. MSC15.2]|uniref:hypothetical protein n=1 Tax=Halorussus sp. MSC15.2 TaxID=2283638 RepID=UPI0013D330A7|nr:hypothetical protein [Halorussus sp. MSC15.2]NEU55721.1 hypothetical protein [Halorussus sp. MSC15.2]
MASVALPRTVVSLVLLLSVTTGCLQPLDGDSRDETELGSHALTVEKEEVATTPNSIIDFEELAPRQQNTFERALNGSYNTTRIPEGVDYDVWYDHEYVRYRNETYSVVVSAP